jgi:hypothetical protein
MSADIDLTKSEVEKPSEAWLTAALAEHSAIRGEVVAALAAQHAVFSYGVAAVGLLTAVAVGATNGGNESGHALATMILLGLNPVLLVAVLFLWTSEVLRMQRAGAYLFVLESVINARVGEPLPLAWEGLVNPPWQRERDAVRIFPHVDVMQRVAVSLALTAITLGSFASGIALGNPGPGRYLAGALVGITTAYFMLLVWAFFDGNRCWLRRLYGEIRDQSAAGSTPSSVHAWAKDVPKNSWRAEVRGPLHYLPFAWEQRPAAKAGAEDPAPR